MFEQKNRIRNVNVVVLIIIFCFIFNSGFFVSAVAENDSLTLPGFVNDANSVLPAKKTTSTGIELILIPAGEYTVSYRVLEEIILPPDRTKDDSNQLISEAIFADAGLLHLLKKPPVNPNPVSLVYENMSRRIVISKPFYLGKYPVTQRQWEEIMESNPSKFSGNPDNPVENVNWYAAQEFISRINTKESTDRYRLPTSAEWQYASDGMQTVQYWGNNFSEIVNYGWFYGNSGGTTHPVGMKLPNKWNLYDMLGNVCEWVQDVFNLETCGTPSVCKGLDGDMPVLVDPIRSPLDGFGILRGGTWNRDTLLALGNFSSGVKDGGIAGLRLALSVD